MGGGAVGDTDVIACSNQKGGTGKTTTAVHLGCALAELGLQVLVWDLDTNHGATSHLGCAPDRVGSCEVLLGDVHPARVIVPATSPAGVDLLPASRALERLDRELASRSDGYTQSWQCLRGPLAQLRALGRYDLVLLDTGPNQVLPTRAAYAAATGFLAVVRPERPSAEGLASVLTDLAAAQQHGVNPALRFLGAVLNNVDVRTELGRHYARTYEELFEARGLPGALFRAQIPTATGFARAWQRRQTLFAFDPRHRALTSVRALAVELLERLGRSAPQRRIASAPNVQPTAAA